MVRLTREQVYFSETQLAWLQRRAEEIGISWQEFLRYVVQAAKDADERHPRRGGQIVIPPEEPGAR